MEKIKPLKEMTPKERVSYIFDYYKFHILGVLIAIIAIVSIVRTLVTSRDPVIELLMVNSDVADTEALQDSFDDLLTENGLDPKKKCVQINDSLIIDYNNTANYQEQATLQVFVVSGTFSGFFSDAATFEHYKGNNIFCDLEQLLPDDLLEKYSSDFIYDTDSDTGRSYICGVHLTQENNAWLASTKAYEECYFGIPFSDTDETLTVALLEHILSASEQ